MIFLRAYDAAYYTRWVQRTLQIPGDGGLFWLVMICKRFEELVDCLVSQPLTVIHGEYYAHNVLYRHGRIHPVEWETTAMAAGGMDLAALTDGYPAAEMRDCEIEYRRARSPHGAPANFLLNLSAARLPLHIRWLVEEPYWKTAGQLWRVKHVRSVAAELGLT
jgi:hypothetical protein